MEQPNALIWGALDYSHIFMSSWWTDSVMHHVTHSRLTSVWTKSIRMSKWTSSSDTETVTLVRTVWGTSGQSFLADLLRDFKDGIRELDPKRLLHGWTKWVWTGTGSSTLFWHENAKHSNSPNVWTSAAEKSWKQFKLSWKSRGIVLSGCCGNPVIYGTNKNDINHSHFENI